MYWYTEDRVTAASSILVDLQKLLCLNHKRIMGEEHVMLILACNPFNTLLICIMHYNATTYLINM